MDHNLIHKIYICEIHLRTALDFPGSAVVKNPPLMQGTQVRALVQEDPSCHGATKPLRHNY